METCTGLGRRLVIWVTETGDGSYGNRLVFRRDCENTTPLRQTGKVAEAMKYRVQELS